MSLRPLVEEEIAAAARSASIAFAVPVDDCVKWLEGAGLGALRALDEGEGPVAYMMRVAMGQFVHGVSLSTLGIAGVTVPPEHRAKGHGRTLMERVLRAAFDEGFVLSSLYPSTQTLYRSVGYEQCGAMFEHRVGRGEFHGHRAGEFEVRALSPEAPEVRALYKTFASRSNGYLDRGEYVWGRIAKHRGTAFECLGCYRPDETLAAYACLAQVREGDEVQLKVRDFAYEDADGARAVLALIDRFTTVSDEVLLYGGPVLPLLSLLPQQKFSVSKVEYTMFRVVSVERALSERRYPKGLRATVCLSIRDGVIAENNGAFTCEIAGGRAIVRRGEPDATLRATMDVRALAPLFTSWSSATTLASIGAIEADADACAVLDAVFAGAPPSLCDYF